MTNNDIIRQVRYIYDFNDDKMIQLFKLAKFEATRSMISNWLKKEEDEQFEPIMDVELAIFLNGFIADKRGCERRSKPCCLRRY